MCYKLSNIYYSPNHSGLGCYHRPKIDFFSSFLIDLFFKMKSILIQCKIPKLKRPNGVKMALRLKSVFFGSQNFVFDCQNLLFLNLFAINCLCISFLSYLWVSHNQSIEFQTSEAKKRMLVFWIRPFNPF